MPTYRRWTRSAIGCYLRGCVCEGCIYHEFFKPSGHICQMKTAVLYLVREFGAPERSMLEDPRIDEDDDD